MTQNGDHFAAALDCLNFRIRRCSRLINRAYDDALRPFGLRATQFNLLIPLVLAGDQTINRLADIVVLERSAVARNLKPLERDGLVRIKPGADRRTRVVSLTAKGRKLLTTALPAWREVQRTLVTALGERNARQLTASLSQLEEMNTAD